jgi:nicotinate dehydrogenase subunit B
VLSVYRTLPLGFDIPKLEMILINRIDWDATGADELSTTAAVGNAIFNAIGVRLRGLPLTPERVKVGHSQT